MTAIQTLHKVVEIAEKRRDEARAALAQQQRELQIAQDQMQQLQTYAQEAQSRWSARSSSGVDATQLFHHRQFMQ
ncbi:MAG: flagellar export protein FliJ, partial [Comamonadaceae bacterium]|nr:flagellar export protein FliJ [Comamonadaceae bacterium]